MNDLFKDFPRPWRLQGRYVFAANDSVVYCDELHYPGSDLCDEQWEQLIRFVNERAEEIKPLQTTVPILD